MLIRSIACLALTAAVATPAFAGISQGGGEPTAQSFVLPPIVLTQDVSNIIRVIHPRGDGSGGGPQGGDGSGPPRTALSFGERTDFEAQITNRLGRSTSFLVIDIIPDPIHDYAPGQFESLSFDPESGFGIESIADELGEDGRDINFDAAFLRDDTRIQIDFTEGDTFDDFEAFNFSFTVLNESGELVPVGFRLTVPAPGTAMMLGLGALAPLRRRR